MKIEFEFTDLDNRSSELIPEFCNLLVKEISSSIINNSYGKVGFKYLEKFLLNSDLVEWKKNKPDNIDVHSIIIQIAGSIVCRNIKENKYVIEINKRSKLHGSKTPLSKIARFIDRGDIMSSGYPTNLVNYVFMKYKQNINEYWKSFVQIRLKRLNVLSVIIVK